MTGDRELAREALDRALELATGLAASPAKARATSLASRILMLAGEHRESIRVGEEALEMAAQLGLDEIRAATLNNVGSSRGAAGERGKGMDEIAEAIDVARAANAHFEQCRAMGNLAALYWTGGRLREGWRLWMDASEEADRYGQVSFARWFDGILVDKEYEFGLWDGAIARADAFLAEVEAGSPHYLSGQVYVNRALLRLGRGDADGAIVDAERALELARRAGDPQIVHQTNALSAHVFWEVGQTDRAIALADEFLAAIQTERSGDFSIGFSLVLAWTLAAGGRGEEAASALEEWREIPWALAGAAYARGDYVAAAEQCAAIGAVTQEAYSRLAAARAGDLTQLERALEFYRSVGGTWYLRQGESLVAASA
jgi:tetratricopeptide (TPR) repeat protein